MLATARPEVTSATICVCAPSVLIVGDHDGFRESAGALLEAEGFAMAGENADGAEALVRWPDGGRM